MHFSSLYEILNNNVVQENKLLVNSSYSKYLIYTATKLGFSIENPFFIKNIKFFSKYYLTKRNLRGYSLKSDTYLFKNKKNKVCSFLAPLHNNRITSVIKKLDSILKIDAKAPFLFHSIVKGGFRVYAVNGLVGFFPKTQIQKLYTDLSFSIKLKLLLKNFVNSPFFFIWIMPKTLIIKLRSVVYNLRKKRKRKIYSNFVFLCSCTQ